jgi:hypothetical protein
MRLRLMAGVTVCVLVGALASPAAHTAPNAQSADCFPFERLSEPLRARAEGMLLRALDGEALYTIAGGLKPMSSGFVSTSITVDTPDLEDAELTRQVLAAWTCGGEIAAGLHHFAAVHQGARSMEAVVFHRPALRRLLVSHAPFFAPFGLSPSSDPMEVVMTVEYAATSARLRGYGHLFGYPDYAVDFFVTASETQRAEEEATGTGTLVPRDFFTLQTVRGERRFVYAVPKGHEPNDADRALKAAADALFADYATRRERHITGDDASGVLALVREWFDDGTGDVRPSHARRPPKPID